MSSRFAFLIFFLLVGWTTAYSQNQSVDPVLSPNQTLIKSIFFGGGSAYVDPVQKKELEEFIYSVENINRYEVLIHSFTDNIGSRIYNQWLSEQRSTAVIEILYQLDLDIDLMLKEDFGEDDPLYNNATLEGKLKNRRVDVILRPLSF